MGAGRREAERGQKGRREEEKVTERALVGREEREETIAGQVQFSLEGFQRAAGTETLHLRGTRAVKNAIKRVNFETTEFRIR